MSAIGRGEVRGMTEQQTPSWRAWHRPHPGVPWQPGPAGRSEIEVVNRALDLQLGTDWCFLPMGQNPNEPQPLPAAGKQGTPCPPDERQMELFA